MYRSTDKHLNSIFRKRHQSTFGSRSKELNAQRLPKTDRRWPLYVIKIILYRFQNHIIFGLCGWCIWVCYFIYYFIVACSAVQPYALSHCLSFCTFQRLVTSFSSVMTLRVLIVFLLGGMTFSNSLFFTDFTMFFFLIDFVREIFSNEFLLFTCFFEKKQTVSVQMWALNWIYLWMQTAKVQDIHQMDKWKYLMATQIRRYTTN